MIGRKLYKTKLCILFQRGRCPRQSCNFAHGEAELRRFGGPFNGRQDRRSGDLRDKLERRLSPHRRLSPGRDGRVHRSFHYQKPISHDRGSSLSRSPIRRSERRHRKKQHTDGESDASENYKASDVLEERKKAENTSSYDDKYSLEEQLKQLQLDVEMLDDHKSQLELHLDEKVDEAHKLSSRIEELESQLNHEQEDCRRITSKIKKFIRAYGRHIKAQEELKRSQARLQKIGDQLSSHTLKDNANEDDPSININSEGELNDDGKVSPRDIDSLSNLLSFKKRQPEYPATNKVKTGNPRKRERDLEVTFRSDKPTSSRGPTQSETISKGIETMKTFVTRNRSLVEGYNLKHGRSGSSIGASLAKGKTSEMRHPLPLTSMAAHAVDQLLDAIEFDENLEARETAKASETDVDYGTKFAYMPLAPSLPQNAYKQLEGDEVEAEKVDSDMFDLDINCEVDIEQVPGRQIKIVKGPGELMKRLEREISARNSQGFNFGAELTCRERQIDKSSMPSVAHD